MSTQCKTSTKSLVSDTCSTMWSNLPQTLCESLVFTTKRRGNGVAAFLKTISDDNAKPM